MGGMGGMGAGFPPAAAAASTSAQPSANIHHITTTAQLQSLLASAGSKLVVVDYFTTWCGPCKAIAPVFNDLANQHSAHCVFIKVDADRARELCMEKGVQGYPTFHFYHHHSLVDSFSGADVQRLRSIIERHVEDASRPKPSPYKHFPLKEAELVKYQEIKWELVEPKFSENNNSVAAAPSGEDKQLTAGQKLDESEMKSLESFISTIKARQSYHSSSITSAQFSVLAKLLSWPKECRSPAINLVRVALFHPEVAKYYAEQISNKTQQDLLSILLRLALSSEKAVSAMLIVRVVANMFHRRVLAKAVGSRFEEIIETTSTLYTKYADDNLRLSIIAVWINLAILFTEDAKYFEQAKVLLLTSVQEALQQSPLDSRIAYRCCVIIGTLLYADSNATSLARDIDIADSVQRAAASDQRCKEDQQVQQVKDEIQKLIKQSS